MPYTHETGGDLSSGSKFLDQVGTYHFLVTGVDETPTKKDGSLIDNAAFRADLSVLAGTVDGQKDKVADILFFAPKPADKNDGAFAKKKIDLFFLATGLATKEELSEKGRKLAVNLHDAEGSQLIAKFVMEERDGKERLTLNFSDIWHVDDPSCKSVPKDAESLAMLPSSRRWIGDQAKPAEKPAEKPTAQPAAATADYSDL